MNVYLGANEIDPQTLGSLDFLGIYKGSDIVWTPAPSTIRLYLLSETDGQPSGDGMWTDDSYGEITYLDLPVGANGVRKIESGDAFVAQYNNWASYVTFHYMLNSSPGSLVNFDRIEYRDSSDNLIGIFNLSQSGWGGQILPLDETGMGIQNNDRMVMVFETQTGPSTFTSAATNKGNDILSIVNSSVATMDTMGISGGYAYAVLGNNGFYYLYGNSGTWGNYTFNAIEYDPNNDTVTKYKIDTSSKMYTQLNANQAYWAIRDYFTHGQTSNLFNYAGVNSIQEFGEEIYNVLIS